MQAFIYNMQIHLRFDNKMKDKSRSLNCAREFSFLEIRARLFMINSFLTIFFRIRVEIIAEDTDVIDASRF